MNKLINQIIKAIELAKSTTKEEYSQRYKRFIEPKQ